MTDKPNSGTVQRKAFVCSNCDGVYSDEPVSQCDCMPAQQSFIEGVITYPAPNDQPAEPPRTGHAIPQWLRDQFSHIEDHARKWGGERTFTEMRTKVQAYFEMQRERSESAPCAKSQGSAQPAEQQDEPVGWQFLDNGQWLNGDDRIKDHRANTEAAGYQTRNVYARPAAQAVRTEDQERESFLVWANLEYDVGEGYELNESNVDVVQNLKGWLARAALDTDAAQAVKLPDVDQLSNIIRQVDGNHSLGAGALAEKIIEAVANNQKCSKTSLAAWFGLSYASWLTIPRVVMEAMPQEWQSRMAVLLHEYSALLVNQPEWVVHVQIREGGKIIKAPDWVNNYRHPDRVYLAKLLGRSLAPADLHRCTQPQAHPARCGCKDGDE